MEEYLVVELRRQLGATPILGRQGAPVARVQGTSDQLALHVTLQEAALVDVEQLVPVQAVGQRREAAARHSGDEVHFVEHVDLPALGSDDLHPTQRFKDSVGERGRSGAPSRKREDDQVFGVVVAAVSPARVKAIAFAQVDLLNWGVYWARCTPAEHDQQGDKDQRWNTPRIHVSSAKSPEDQTLEIYPCPRGAHLCQINGRLPPVGESPYWTGYGEFRNATLEGGEAELTVSFARPTGSSRRSHAASARPRS